MRGRRHAWPRRVHSDQDGLGQRSAHFGWLTEAAQLKGLAEPAFVKFLALARDRTACQVFVGGKPVHVDGAILVWGAATEPGRSAAVALGIADVLTVEDMVSDLHAWQPPGWQDFIARRRSWATELFDYLG